MDVGDIISLVVFGIIFLSFFSRFLDRGDDAEQPPVRPTDLSESGGREQRPVVTESHEVAWEDEASAPSHAGGEKSRERYSTSTSTTDVTSGTEIRSEDVRDSSGRNADERRKRSDRQQVQRRRRIVAGEGGDVLRRSLKNPETLERGFIVKEVLDVPVGLRRDS